MTGLSLPSKPYNEVKSQFIKKRISERHFELDSHRKYISDLIFLERVILDEIKLKAYSGMKFSSIRKKHKEEYLKILKELKPEKYHKKQNKAQNKPPSYVNMSKDIEKIQEAKNNWKKVKREI